MEAYFINKAKAVQEKDPHEAKALILTAKTLYPGNFNIQFETYLMEKNENNYQEAAKCFGFIVLNFHNQPALWSEIKKLIAALKEEKTGLANDAEQEFYIQLFQHISYDVQQKIMMLTASHSDNNFDHCRIILLLLKRFPQALNISTHAPRLLETLVKGITTPSEPNKFTEILVQEALPLIKASPPTDMSGPLVHRILSITIGYYINQMFHGNDSNEYLVDEMWSKIFEALELCGRMLKWEPFMGYAKKYSKETYWQKIVQIASLPSTRSAENKQILFCASVLLFLSLHDYINQIKVKINDIEVQHILVEGFTEVDKKRRKLEDNPHLTIPPPCSQEVSNSFLVGYQCWKLLHSNELLQFEFSQFLMSIPYLNQWVSRYLLDISAYMGPRSEEAITLIENNQAISALEKALRSLSYTVSLDTPTGITVQSFEYINAILNLLPNISGSFVKNMTATIPVRNLVFLPLTKKSIVQYCVQIIINGLKFRIFQQDSICSNNLLGNLLVLLQLEFSIGTHETLMETIFDIIRQRRSFCYLHFPKYIINIDIVEEFMNMWHTGDVKLEFVLANSQRRIGTRGSDKADKGDFKHIISQQVLRCNEDVVNLIIRFIQQEHIPLVQCIFEK